MFEQRIGLTVSKDGKPTALVIKGKEVYEQAGLKKPISIGNVDEIESLELITTEEAVMRKKSSVKRAIVGGVLFGGVGAIVGAIDGIGEKMEKNKKYAIAIEMKSGESYYYDLLNSAYIDKFMHQYQKSRK